MAKGWRIRAPQALVSKSAFFALLALIMVLGLSGCPESSPSGKYTCANGTAQGGAPSGSANVESCASCDSGFKLEGMQCVATAYTCSNGTARTGSPPGNSDQKECASCDPDYRLKGTLCEPNFGLLANGVTIACGGVDVGATATINGVTYTKRTAAQIKADRNLATTSCTSGITDMSDLFSNDSDFNPNVSSWDTRSVTNMSSMFQRASSFNQNISNWDVSSVTDMSSMLRGTLAFNQDIGGWNVESVTDMSSMFRSTRVFNQDIGGWNVKNVTNMNAMFTAASAFNQDLSRWCVTNIASKPSFFDASANAGFTQARQPQWGTCPS